MILRNSIYKLMVLIIPALIWSCEEDPASLAPPIAPTNVVLNIDIASDSSGIVTFTPSGTNALTFQLFPGDGTGPEVITPGASYEKQFGGTDSVSFTATLVAYGTGGEASSVSNTFDMFIKVVIDPEVLIALTGDISNSVKQWVWDQEVGGVNGHFGVGSPDTDFPGFFTAEANQLNVCLYDDVLEFAVDANGAPLFNLITQGETFMNGGQLGVLFPGESGDDQCRMADDLLVLNSTFVVRENEGARSTLALGGGILSPLSYFANVPQWEIVELTESRLRVRGLNANGDLAWYHQFIPAE